MYMNNMICTNVIDLARIIAKLNSKGEAYLLSEKKGIYGEDVIMVEWNYVEDEED